MKPFIIIGCHRSGTTMLSKILDNLGVNMGKKLEGNHESIFFLELNKWLLRQSGGRWDNPTPIKYLLDDFEHLELVDQYIRAMFRSPRAMQFMGIKEYLIKRDILKIDKPWGWKDPRNSYTLPFWLRLFPDAKVIHVYRHGLDVASSIVKRNERTLKYYQTSLSKLNQRYWIKPRQACFRVSLICQNYEDCINLWEQYIYQSRKNLKVLNQSQYLEIKYENMLLNSPQTLRGLFDFLDVEVSRSALEDIVSSIQPDRAYAYKKDSQLLHLSEIYRDRLRSLGY